MSLNKLVGGDCGGNNALVQLSHIVSRDASMSQPLPQSDRFVNEFMQAQASQVPQTFNMNALLHNIQQIDTSKQANSQVRSHIPNMGHQMSMPWSAGPSTSFMPYLHMQQPFIAKHNNMPLQAGPSNVQIQYVDETEIGGFADSDVRAKAQEFVKETHEEWNAYNNFMSFMRSVSSGDSHPNHSEEYVQSRFKNDQLLNEMAEKYKEEWDRLSNLTDYWDSETANGIPEHYTFNEGNIMLENKSALDIGKEKLNMGDIPGAVLCFEAAAQQQPDSAEAWFLLGTTQTENEQDPLAITALKKSLQIDPRQLEAYITLATAYINENMPKFAFTTLMDWLRASPKYSDLIPQDIDPKKLDQKELEAHIKSLYLRAAQLNPTQIDPDVQNALGLVFNITQEYDKAADCFRTALMVANDDATLWNKLGATLANGNKSEEAVEAYKAALNLEPGFIRARYNVGITCMNLGAHKQAAEHFLVALNQQYKAKSMFPDATTTDISSSSIWTTLRMVCSFMGEHDIAKFVDDRNLGELNNFFEVDQ